MTTATPPLIEFPCHFPIKVMGLNTPELLPTIYAVVAAQDAQLRMESIEQRESSGGKYMGLTLTVWALDQAHLDDIYRSLTAHPLSKYVL